MARIRVKLRISSVAGRPGTIFYQVTHRKAIRYIKTDIHLLPQDWDANYEKIAESAMRRTFIQNCIDSDILILKRVVKDLDLSEEIYSVEDIAHRYNSSEYRTSVLDFMQQQIDLLNSTNRFGTAQNYIKVKKSFGNFLCGARITFAAMSMQLVNDYHTFLVQRGMVRNSISFYMRIMRAIYNKAVRHNLVEQTHPFREVYTGIDNTSKRAVSESLITDMCKLNLKKGSSIELARDMFIFSYCTRGMAFVDIAYLKKENIQNGVISYKRRKTKQLLNIKIESNIQLLINKYHSDTTPFVFPLLKTNDTKKSYSEYQVAINNHNRMLKKLSEMLHSRCTLTSYTPRHSWATAARNHNVPISIISAGMGHTSEHTTKIYLNTLENSIIDDANQQIIKTISL